MNRPSCGSAIHYTPDHTGQWVVVVAGDVETWTEPVIGWAVVVVARDEAGYDTCIEPVVLDEGQPSTMTHYQEVRFDLRWIVEKAGVEPHPEGEAERIGQPRAETIATAGPLTP